MEINFGKRNAYHSSFNFLTNNLVLTIFCFLIFLSWLPSIIAISLRC